MLPSARRAAAGSPPNGSRTLPSVRRLNAGIPVCTACLGNIPRVYEERMQVDTLARHDAGKLSAARRRVSDQGSYDKLFLIGGEGLRACEKCAPAERKERCELLFVFRLFCRIIKVSVSARN